MNSQRDDENKARVDQPVRIGVVGCGVVAGYGHIPAIAGIEEARLVAVADPDKARRDAQVEKHGVPGYPDMEAMLAAERLDAVALPVHPAIKLDLVRIAAARGLHVFSEKPLSDTVEEAEEIVRLMDEAERFLAIAFIYRGKELVRRMRELITGGAIGRLQAVHVENLWDYHGLRDEAYAKRRRRALENLGTLDCGVHHLDLVRFLSGGEFDQVSAVGRIVEAENRYPDHILAHGRMDNGVLFTVQESAVWGHTAAERPAYVQAYRALGDNGVMTSESTVVNGRQETVLRIVSGGREWTEPLDTEKAWVPAYRQFCQVIRGRNIPDRFLADGRDALANMRIARQVIDLCGTS